MEKLTYDEVFNSISTLKSSFRSVRRKTHALKQHPIENYKERMDKLLEIEQKCVDNAIQNINTNKQFILDAHALLKAHSEAYGMEDYYTEWLHKYTDDGVEKLLSFLETALIAEYSYAIATPKYILNLGLNKESIENHM